jgi:6,7-dimethyl-8-ribityllumazine synthase
MAKTKPAKKPAAKKSASNNSKSSASKNSSKYGSSRLKIGVVRSRFNEEITEKLENGALEFLEGLDEDLEILLVQVPGAIEIPLACQALFDRGCDGIVALGAVIRGETSHYDLVCTTVERGVMQVMLEFGRPIGMGVLTTENEEQALDRAGGRLGNKGYEAAETTIEMIGLIGDLVTKKA